MKREVIKDYLLNAKEALNNQDALFFSKHLPSNEYWRLYKDFQNKTIFLDIETTGLSSYYDVITIVGTYDGLKTKIFVKDNNLDEIQKYLKKHHYSSLLMEKSSISLLFKNFIQILSFHLFISI